MCGVPDPHRSQDSAEHPNPSSRLLRLPLSLSQEDGPRHATQAAGKGRFLYPNNQLLNYLFVSLGSELSGLFFLPRGPIISGLWPFVGWEGELCTCSPFFPNWKVSCGHLLCLFCVDSVT